MNLFDPSRPRVPGTDVCQYMDATGQGVAPIPRMQFWVTPTGWTALVWLLVGANDARCYSTARRDAELDDFLASWREDPEAVLAHAFGWPGFDRRARTPDDGPTVVSGKSADELGL